MTTILKTPYVNSFECLGADCADTCCKGWGMQLDVHTKQKYEGTPELMEAVTTGEAEWIMKRDPNTDYCIKFQDGLCGIQAKYGADYLGDACHFFPRITRHMGEHLIMTASLSCPEIARLALFTTNDTDWKTGNIDRLPASLVDYTVEEIGANGGIAIHQAFIEACLCDDTPAERLLARFLSVVHSLRMLDMASWEAAVPFYLKNADGRLPPAEHDPNDAFNLLYALVGLVDASTATQRPRLERTIKEMEIALDASFTRNPLLIQTSDESYSAWVAMQRRWDAEWSPELNITLKRWLRAELSTNFFPFAGLGESMVERCLLIAVRFATVRLALQSCCVIHNGIPPEEEIIRVIQSLARFLGHLADPTLSLKIYEETGWTKEARLRALVGDFK
jgi:lysine-N-methylase